MQLLAEMSGELLERGDIISFPCGWHHYDDKLKPIDLLVSESNEANAGLALIYCSGWDAGVTRTYLPAESRSERFMNSIRVDWLLANWSDWFCFDVGNDMKVIPIEGVLVYRRQKYSITPDN